MQNVLHRFFMLLKIKTKTKMEEQNSVESCDSDSKMHDIFGEDFAYVALAATIAWTYSIINVVQYL